MATDGEGLRRRHLRRGAALGLRRHRARHPGVVAGRGRHRRLGHARADRPLGARVLRHRRRDQARRLRGHRGRRRLRRRVAAHHRQARRRRVGPERHQGLHLERRHRRRQRRRRDRRPRRSATAARPRSSSRRARPASSRARRRTSSASAPRRPPRSCSRTCACPMENLLGGLDKLERKLERARSRASAAAPRARSPRSRSRARWWARARSASRGRRTSGRSTTSRAASRRRRRPLLEQQRVQQVLADVATEIEAARLLVWRAAWMGRNGIPMTGGQGSMSKLKAGDVTMWATTALMDLVGPEAALTDRPLEKWFRDAKIYQLFEGTAQVQRLVVSRMQARRVPRACAQVGRGRARRRSTNAPADAVAPRERAASSRRLTGFMDRVTSPTCRRNGLHGPCVFVYCRATPNPRGSAGERGTQCGWGESRGSPREAPALSRASPSANPVGLRKRGCVRARRC